MAIWTALSMPTLNFHLEHKLVVRVVQAITPLVHIKRLW
jgi:hypothetical protein